MATWYTLTYQCAECNEEWQDEWDCQVDSECPTCGRDFTPFSVDHEEEITDAEAEYRTT